MDVIFASGDDNALNDKTYNGVLTGNTWGSPGSVFIGSGSYLLFPHGNVVNRYTPVVADLSNMGYGITGAVFNASRDILPYKMQVKMGAATGFSNAKPAGGGLYMGTEVNGKLSWTFGPFMSLELHAAYMMLGDFFDSSDTRYGSDVNGVDNDSRPADPWTAFVVYKWLLF